MTKQITWTNEKRTLRQLSPWEHNPRYIKDAQAERLLESFNEFGQVLPICIGPNNEIYDGHQRKSVIGAANEYGLDYEIDVRVASRELTERERQKLTVYLHKGAAGDWDWEELANSFDFSDLVLWGFDEDQLLGMGWDEPEEVEPADAEPQISRADELLEVWKVQTGDIWKIGEHRLACGDCTDADVVARVMDGEKAALVHADPPYGMGKEKDGIANDNLYRDKLDAFQMQWWSAARPHVEDNGSAYIWGNAEDLWRLWYCGGLKDSERLTFRNEVVWDKANVSGLYDGNGIGSDIGRQYASISERAIFFMLGEQGFNNNADNYWEGWDNIVEYLDSQRRSMGWGIKDTKRIAGHSEKSGCHWFDKSQWSMPTEEVYKAWQAAAQGDAFKREYDDLKREYDDLKREFYATRAYFDNTHDNMIDVWSFPRVTGDDRHEHATPKPVAMMERAIKSSAPIDGVVYTPFGGTGPELVACQNTKRKSRMVELSAPYCAVILQRMQDAFPALPIERL